MATVVNLPPDPSFGSGRAGVAIGRFITGLVESRRKKALDEERSAIIQRAFDDARLETDPTLKASVFTQGISKTPGIKPEGIKSLTDTFIELGKARREADQAEALADVFGGSGGDITKSGKVGKPAGEAGQPKIDRATARALGDQFLPMLKLMSDNRKAASTAKLNESKIQRAIDQTKNDLKKLENQRDKTAISQEQLRLSKTDSGRKERRFSLDKQKHALDQKIEGRKQELADLNATKAEQVAARDKRKLEIDEAELLIKKAKEERALKESELPEAEKLERLEGREKAKVLGKLSARMEKMREIMDTADGGVISQHAAPPLPPKEVFAGFGEGTVAGKDMQTVTRMMRTAANLAAAGFTQESNNLLSQARLFANNSPGIARNKDLDKILSDRMLSELQLPFGSTGRDALSLTPRSPEELAKAVATAKAEGTALVKAKQDLGFISEAQSSIKGLLLQVEGDPKRGIIGDPGLVGIIGSLRRTGKLALGIIGDLGLTGLIEGAKDLAFSNTDLTAKEQFDLFSSPTLSVLQLIEHSVGLTFARLRTPVGRVPVAVIKISLQDMQLAGGLPSNMVVDRLHFMSNLLASRGRNIKERHGLTSKKEIPRYRIDKGRLIQY